MATDVSWQLQLSWANKNIDIAQSNLQDQGGANGVTSNKLQPCSFIYKMELILMPILCSSKGGCKDPVRFLSRYFAHFECL